MVAFHYYYVVYIASLIRIGRFVYTYLSALGGLLVIHFIIHFLHHNAFICPAETLSEAQWLRILFDEVSAQSHETFIETSEWSGAIRLRETHSKIA